MEGFSGFLMVRGGFFDGFLGNGPGRGLEGFWRVLGNIMVSQDLAVPRIVTTDPRAWGFRGGPWEVPGGQKPSKTMKKQ